MEQPDVWRPCPQEAPAEAHRIRWLIRIPTILPKTSTQEGRVDFRLTSARPQLAIVTLGRDSQVRCGAVKVHAQFGRRDRPARVRDPVAVFEVDLVERRAAAAPGV